MPGCATAVSGYTLAAAPLAHLILPCVQSFVHDHAPTNESPVAQHTYGQTMVIMDHYASDAREGTPTIVDLVH